jgi:hypothetical protein
LDLEAVADTAVALQRNASSTFSALLFALSKLYASTPGDIMAHLNPRWIVGKTVARVDLGCFPDGRGDTAHNPGIWFTDGSSIGFCDRRN